MILKEPAKILRNFLSSKLTELVRTGHSLRTTEDSETFNGDGSTTEFVITRTDVLSIGEVTVGGSKQTPYLHYNIDLDNHKIIFVTAPGVGIDNVSIIYKYGDEDWVFESENSNILTEAAYPFININTITESGTLQAVSEDDTFDTLTFQIDVMVFKDMLCTIDGESLEGPNVKEYLARQVLTICLKDWRDEIDYKLFGPVKLSNGPAPFDEGQNNFRNIIEISYQAFNIGE